MENEITKKESTKEIPTIWKWYFGWHPRILLTVPIFLFFVYSGIWFIFAEISDIVFLFQTTPVTWGSIFLIMFLGSFLIMLILLPIYICFYAISWLYEIIVGNYTSWKKFLYTVGVILLVLFGTSLVRLFTAWIFGILN